MTIRVAVNGFGRIGRNIVRALYENNYQEKITIVAINDLGDIESNAHLLKYDSVHGQFAEKISYENSCLFVAEQAIHVFSEKDPLDLPWESLDIDIVFECTGKFTNKSSAELHRKAGAKKVIISAPGNDVDATIVYGVNEKCLTSSHAVISNASCTTNCLAPIAKILDEHFSIESGLMTTIHAATNDQSITDVYHTDPFRARSAMLSMIPTKTGAAAAIGEVLPHLKGKFEGLAVRVPIANVSLIDLTVSVKKETCIEDVNEIMKAASDNSVILDYNALPLVSCDFNHNSASAIFDGNHTKVIGKQIKIMAWYDNEWGFSNRMLDNAIALMNSHYLGSTHV